MDVMTGRKSGLDIIDNLIVKMHPGERDMQNNKMLKMHMMHRDENYLEITS